MSGLGNALPPIPLRFLNQHGVLQIINQSSQWCGIVQETGIHVVLSSFVPILSHCQLFLVQVTVTGNNMLYMQVCTMATNDTRNGRAAAKY